MLRKLPLGLLVAIAVYVALRAMILVSAFDQVAMPNYEQYPMGTLPKVLSLGVDIPFDFYYDNAAGQLLTGFAAVPFYAAVGESYLALKLVPAMFGLLAVIAVYLLLRQSFSRGAANVGAILFAIGPATTVTKYSLMASGNHFENLFFSSLALLCYYRVHARDDGRRLWLGLAGFTGGLALFVFLGAIIPVGLTALMHLGSRGWRGSVKDLRFYGPAFALGTLPLFVLNARTATEESMGRGAAFLEHKFGGEGFFAPGRVLGRMGDFLGDDLLEAGFFDEFLGLSKGVPNALFLVCFLLAWAYALPAVLAGIRTFGRGAVSGEIPVSDARAAFERMKLAPFVLYLPLAALAFGLSDLRIGGHPKPIECAGYRYFLTHFLFATVLVAIAVERLWASGGTNARIVGGALLGAVLFTGSWNLSYLDFELRNPNLGSHYPGYNFLQGSRGIYDPDNRLTRAEMSAYADELGGAFRNDVYMGFGFHDTRVKIVVIQQESASKHARNPLLRILRNQPLDLDAVLEGWPEEWRPAVAAGAGGGLRNLAQSNEEGYDALVAQLLLLERTGHPLFRDVVEGSAFLQDRLPMHFRLGWLLTREGELLKRMPDRLKQDFGRGVGRLCGRILRREIEPEAPMLTKFLYSIHPEVGDELIRGLGIGLAEGGEEPAIVAAALDIVPEVKRGPLYEGFVGTVRRLHGDEAARSWSTKLEGQ